LGYRRFGAIDNIADELPEEKKSDLSGHVQMALAVVIGEIDVIAGAVRGGRFDVLSGLELVARLPQEPTKTSSRCSNARMEDTKQ
jgi:hypothetical protein